jgi:hypothetical protein
VFDTIFPKDHDFDAVIEHHNHVCEIHILGLESSRLQQLASTIMQLQFPVLTHLRLGCVPCSPATVLPDGFLGEHVPRLKSLELLYVPFPVLQKLLLSANDLVRLILMEIPIPIPGYISPKEIVTCLASLTKLEYFAIGFNFVSVLDRASQDAPPRCTVLPALTHFEFQGTGEYLEVLVALIDAPLLDTIRIAVPLELFRFSFSQLARCMQSTTRFEALNETRVEFDDRRLRVKFLPPTPTIVKNSTLRISCQRRDWLIPWAAPMAGFFTSIFPSIFIVETLYITRSQDILFQTQHQVETEKFRWLEFFRMLTAVKNLYLSKEFALHIFPASQHLVGERVADVLPALESLFLEELQPLGPVQEAIEPFVAGRQLSGHPVAVSRWDGI